MSKWNTPLNTSGYHVFVCLSQDTFTMSVKNRVDYEFHGGEEPET